MSKTVFEVKIPKGQCVGYIYSEDPLSFIPAPAEFEKIRIPRSSHQGRMKFLLSFLKMFSLRLAYCILTCLVYLYLWLFGSEREEKFQSFLPFKNQELSN